MRKGEENTHMREDVIIMPFKSSNIPVAVPSIGKTHADANYRIYKPCEDNYAFEFILSGKGYIRTEKGLQTLSAGDVFISRPFIPRDYYADPKEPFEKFFFIVIGDLPESILKSHQLYNTVYHAPECLSVFENLFQAAKREKTYTEICRQCATSILKIADIVHFSAITQASIPEYVRVAKAYIDANYAKKLTMEEVAEHIHTSLSQLNRAFKKYYQATPYQYLLNLKLEAAKILLTSSKFSIKKIALELGFCDEHYFSNAFRQKIGVSPSKYANL